MTRKGLSKKTRFEIFKRDGFTCAYCGAHPPAVVLQVDHIEPIAAGGSDTSDNLITSCESCNQGNGARKLGAAPEALSAKAARIAESEEQLRGYQAVMRAKTARIENAAWEAAETLYPGAIERGIRAKDLRTIKYFIGRLGIIEVLDMVDVAMGKCPWGGSKMFAYFCGCCWRCIRRQDGSEE